LSGGSGGKKNKSAGPEKHSRWWSLSHLRAMFGFAADKKAEEIDADIRRRIRTAFDLVPVDSTGAADIAHVAELLSSVTGGRELPKELSKELAQVVKLLDHERKGTAGALNAARHVIHPTYFTLGPRVARYPVTRQACATRLCGTARSTRASSRAG